MAVLLTSVAMGCAEPAPPPGPTVDSVPASAELTPPPVATATATAPDVDLEAQMRPGRGHQLASIAMRTWVYQEPHEDGVKLGYLRAGAVIDRAELSAGNDGCDGGWYRVAPRGYVCVGKGATLETNHPVVAAAPQGPRRGEPMP